MRNRPPLYYHFTRHLVSTDGQLTLHLRRIRLSEAEHIASDGALDQPRKTAESDVESCRSLGLRPLLLEIEPQSDVWQIAVLAPASRPSAPPWSWAR